MSSVAVMLGALYRVLVLAAVKSQTPLWCIVLHRTTLQLHSTGKSTPIATAVHRQSHAVHSLGPARWWTWRHCAAGDACMMSTSRPAGFNHTTPCHPAALLQQSLAPSQRPLHIAHSDPAFILSPCCKFLLQVTCPHGVKRPQAAASFNRGPGAVRPVLAGNLSKLRINRPTPLQG
jgi:hypothetical protein